MHFSDILTFWFYEIEPKKWWKKDKKFDDLLRCRFLNIHSLAIKSKLTSWRTSDKGRLAEIIVIDQLSRNLFRNKPEAFKSDHLALFYQKRSSVWNFTKILIKVKKYLLLCHLCTVKFLKTKLFH